MSTLIGVLVVGMLAAAGWYLYKGGYLGSLIAKFRAKTKKRK